MFWVVLAILRKVAYVPHPFAFDAKYRFSIFIDCKDSSSNYYNILPVLYRLLPLVSEAVECLVDVHY